MCKDVNNHLLNRAAGLSDGAVFSPSVPCSWNVSGDACTVLVEADESVLRTVYTECATSTCIPASEEHPASTAYFFATSICSCPFFTLLPPLPTPGFPLQAFFLPHLPPPQVLRWDSFCSFRSFLTLKPRRLDRKATQHDTQPRVRIWCSLQTSQISICANEVLGELIHCCAGVTVRPSESLHLSRMIHGGMRQALTASLETGDQHPCRPWPRSVPESAKRRSLHGADQILAAR